MGGEVSKRGKKRLRRRGSSGATTSGEGIPGCGCRSRFIYGRGIGRAKSEQQRSRGSNRRTQQQPSAPLPSRGSTQGWRSSGLGYRGAGRGPWLPQRCCTYSSAFLSPSFPLVLTYSQSGQAGQQCDPMRSRKQGLSRRAHRSA